MQLRDKTASTAELVKRANRVHEITKKHGVPLIINDRIDVALAVGAEGVHLGQDDLGIQIARELLGDEAIIGVTVHTVEQALHALKGGAEYLGIGTVYPTPT